MIRVGYERSLYTLVIALALAQHKNEVGIYPLEKAGEILVVYFMIIKYSIS
jgi:hypothetical protein